MGGGEFGGAQAGRPRPLLLPHLRFIGWAESPRGGLHPPQADALMLVVTRTLLPPLRGIPKGVSGGFCSWPLAGSTADYSESPH